MTAKTLLDLEAECCHLAALAGGLEVLEWESYGDDPQAKASRAALRPIILNLAARLDALQNDLANVRDAERIVVQNAPEATAA